MVVLQIEKRCCDGNCKYLFYVQNRIQCQYQAVHNAEYDTGEATLSESLFSNKPFV